MDKAHRIAIVSAGLLVGAQIGLAAMTESAERETEAASSEEIAEAPATPIETAALGTETAAAPSEAAVTAEIEQPILPEVVYYADVRSLFPASGDDLQLLPAMADYLDRMERVRFAGASPNVYPAFADELPMLPVTAAYVQQREAAVLAELYGAPAATAVAETTIPATNGGTPAPAAASAPEVTALGGSSTASY
jgi:hypothetical protein